MIQLSVSFSASISVSAARHWSVYSAEASLAGAFPVSQPSASYAYHPHVLDDVILDLVVPPAPVYFNALEAVPGPVEIFTSLFLALPGPASVSSDAYLTPLFPIIQLPPPLSSQDFSLSYRILSVPGDAAFSSLSIGASALDFSLSDVFVISSRFSFFSFSSPSPPLLSSPACSVMPHISTTVLLSFPPECAPVFSVQAPLTSTFLFLPPVSLPSQTFPVSIACSCTVHDPVFADISLAVSLTFPDIAHSFMIGPPGKAISFDFWYSLAFPTSPEISLSIIPGVSISLAPLFVPQEILAVLDIFSVLWHAGCGFFSFTVNARRF